MNTLKEKLAILPTEPGCYLMKDRQGTVIYVGKANVLKNRVRSYFTGAHDRKTERLVSEIVDFEYIVTKSNVDALILELNLIKEHDPKYNVMFKDDKSYPYLKITNEKYPRLLITRRVKKDGGKYFGPYPNASAATETKRLLDRLYPLRKCRTLPKSVCLYYHIDQCLAPCVHEVTKEQNEQIVKDITSFLRAGHAETKKELVHKMNKASEELDFERAMEFRDTISHLEAIMERQKIALNDHIDRDVFGYWYEKGWMCVQVFFIRQGQLIERDVSIFPFYKEPEEDLLTYIGQFYTEKDHLKPQEIFVPVGIDAEVVEQLLHVKTHYPQRGKKKELVDLANKNAKVALHEKFTLIERDEERTIIAVENLGKAMGIHTPHRIEAFDNSNIHGADPVSAMVTFLDGKPSKKDYRKYKIKTVEGSDDYGSMREVIRRRYVRLLNEQLPLPDLIVVDGGKGQISAAQEVVEDELGLSIPVCGLAKDEKHRTSTLLKGDPPEVIPLQRDSNEFHLLQRIQDEVHRFAISFHRKTRTKSSFRSILDDIPGVGPKRKQALLSHFGSIKHIKKATIEEIQSLSIPRNVAKAIINTLND